MEYTYIRDIDKIIEDKDKLKEVLLFLLNTNAKRYDDYTSKQLYEVFCDEPLRNFIDILNNMICYEYRLECFSNYLSDFHRRGRIDLKNNQISKSTSKMVKTFSEFINESLDY